LNDAEKGLKDKLEPEDAETIDEAVKEAINWLDDNMAAEKDDYEEKRKEFEGIVHPIFAKVGGGPGGPGGPSGGQGFEDDEMPNHDDL